MITAPEMGFIAPPLGVNLSVASGLTGEPILRIARKAISFVLFMKIVTRQCATRQGTRSIAEATARISRLEGTEGHARTIDIRLRKRFPGENFNLSGTDLDI